MESLRLDVPVLPNGFRLHWDKVRQRHVILYPEGALGLNETAVQVLELCDGKRTIEDIADELSARFGGADVHDDVENLLISLANIGMVKDAGN
ncbi:MAG TPA: pyrroloquinoline quinone biosynthesis peptide chaperone PqqD [Gaiellaceae bacterium]|nr:pyrroloquinoline quinone biosynthesis peptide chaperone PqqD [Gaiellaceae bacterium]